MKTMMLRLVALASCVVSGETFLILVPSREASRTEQFAPKPRRHAVVMHHSSASISFDSAVVPQLSDDNLKTLKSQGYVVIPNFISSDLQAALRQDVDTLRSLDKFRIANIGQDSTNTLNQEIRVAETCFLGESKLKDVPSSARSYLYRVLDTVRDDLPDTLDSALTELLYVYYPKGGFYRRHRDAIPGSASVLREISLLLYLNENWTPQDGGQLLLHLDSGGDELPEGEEPNYIEVTPEGGTLVLLKSDQIPHEVLDTKAERLAVVGWYNRPVTASDVASLSNNSLQPILLGLSAALITVGLVALLT